MPYTGPGDDALPANVKKLPERARAQWVNVWNSAYKRCQDKDGDDCESSAFAQANGVVNRRKARIYVTGRNAPAGVAIHNGPRGGRYFNSEELPSKPARVKPAAEKKPPKGAKPKEPKPEKHVVGQPYKGVGDATLPPKVLAESAAVQAAWVDTFNKALEAGGSEADALAAANRAAIPKRTPPRVVKPRKPKPKKHEIGTAYEDGDDPTLPGRVRLESDSVREQWTASFNETIAAGGSEADAINAANHRLPKRSKKEMTMMPMRAMICLYPDPTIARLMAIQGDLPEGVQVELPEDLHVTLAYFLDVKCQEDVDYVLQSAAHAAELYWPGNQVVTKVTGIARFLAHDDLVPHVFLVDPTAIDPIHECLEYCVGVSREHGYIPHMTVAYASADVPLIIGPPPDLTLTFDRLSVKFSDGMGGGMRHDFRFGGAGSGPDVAAYRERLREKFDEQAASDDRDNRSRLETSHLYFGNKDDMSTATIATEKTVLEKHEGGSKAGRRVAGSMRDALRNAVDALKGVMSWADYEDMDAMMDDEGEEMEVKDGAFYVFKDALGQDRWLSFSSNGFQDREKEIVATGALEADVTRADKDGDRGALRLFHVPGTDIGECDFQAVEGRFLIESGTFLDSPLAEAAKAYFGNPDEELGVSIGFIYPKDTFVNGIYKQARIIERSVCPWEAVANPYTSFRLLTKEGPMDALKSSWISKIAGAEQAEAIIAKAQEATKALEGTVAFKDSKAPDVVGAIATLQALAANADAPVAFKDALAALTKAIDTPETTVDGGESKTDAETPKAETPKADATPAADDSFAERIIAVLKPAITEANAATVKAVEAIDERLKTLEGEQKAIAERVGLASRAAGSYKASESDTNILDGQKAKELLGDQDPPVSPVQAYVADFIKTGAAQ